MSIREQLYTSVLSLDGTQRSFENISLELFKFQYENNEIYRRFVDLGARNVRNISRIQQIPFLPIQFFKTNDVRTGLFEPQLIFESSGTTGTINSKHPVREIRIYDAVSRSTFESIYG
ncbi:MAG: acyl transferase, partial [Leadbetterella sp.]